MKRHADAITIDYLIDLRKKLAEAERQRENALDAVVALRAKILEAEMPRADRYKPHIDYCLKARAKGLDDVAEYIHSLVKEIDRLREALREINKRNPFHNAVPLMDKQYYAQIIVEMVGIANAALKEGE